MYLKNRLVQSSSLSQQSALRGNDAICAYQAGLIAPIERAYADGKITRQQYVQQYQAANEKVRAFTSEVQS